MASQQTNSQDQAVAESIAKLIANDFSSVIHVANSYPIPNDLVITGTSPTGPISSSFNQVSPAANPRPIGSPNLQAFVRWHHYITILTAFLGIYRNQGKSFEFWINYIKGMALHFVNSYTGVRTILPRIINELYDHLITRFQTNPGPHSITSLIANRSSAIPIAIRMMKDNFKKVWQVVRTRRNHSVLMRHWYDDRQSYVFGSLSFSEIEIQERLEWSSDGEDLEPLENWRDESISRIGSVGAASIESTDDGGCGTEA